MPTITRNRNDDVVTRGCGCGGCLYFFIVITAITNFFSWLWGILWPIGFFVLLAVCLIVVALIAEGRKEKPVATKKEYSHKETIDTTSPSKETQETQHKPISERTFPPLILCPNCKRLILDASKPCSTCSDTTHIKGD